VVANNPLFAGAWLDLAIAAFRSGDPAAALEHLLYLKQQFVIPVPLAVQVEHLIEQLQDAFYQTTRATWQGEVWLGSGKDSNANLGLLHNQIELSLPTGSTSFNIADDFLPRADQFTLFGFTLAGPTLDVPGGAQVSPVVLFRHKAFLKETDFNVLDLQAGLIYQRSLPQGVDWQASLMAQNYQLGGQAQFNALRFGLQRSQPWGACKVSSGSVVETRDEQLASALGGITFSLKAGLACPLPGNALLGADLTTGFEPANPNRAGGSTQTTQLGFRLDKPLSTVLSFHASWQITQSNDQTGYSPLIENNATRAASSQAFSLSLRQTLSPRSQTRLSFDSLRQRSNLPLFEKQGTQLMLSLHYQID
jgi:hypothetical protein